MPCSRLRLVQVALAALAGGLLLYAGSREETLLTPYLPVLPSVSFPLSGSLPSALHAYAFALLGLALWPLNRRRAALCCLGWASLAGALELAQLFSPSALAASSPLLHIARGTFDTADLIAITAGVAGGYATAQVSGAVRRSAAPRGRRLAVPLLVAAAVLTSVATSPPPRGAVSSDLKEACPGSKAILAWRLPSGKRATLIASDPEAFSPSFAHRRVEETGEMEITIRGDVEFRLEFDEESDRYDPYRPATVTVIPPEGLERVVGNSPMCVGGQLEWEPTVVSVKDYDKRAQVETVTPHAGPHPAIDFLDVPLTVEHGLVRATVRPAEESDAFRGTPFVGAWQIEPAEPRRYECTANSLDAPSTGVKVRIVCPVENARHQGR